MSEVPEHTTRMLAAASRGDAEAAARLMPIVYDGLRELASGYLRRERADHTLQPTSLVNEAYLKLVGQPEKDWAGRTHFLAVAAQGMRQILVDHARLRGAQKRGGGWRRVALDDALDVTQTGAVDFGALHDALGELAEEDERAARIVELRFFGGLTNADVASVLDVSLTTVESDWRHARAWLARRLGPAPESAP